MKVQKKGGGCGKNIRKKELKGLRKLPIIPGFRNTVWIFIRDLVKRIHISEDNWMAWPLSFLSSSEIKILCSRLNMLIRSRGGEEQTQMKSLKPAWIWEW